MDPIVELRFRTELESLITEREGMRWHNEIRLQCNLTVAYGEHEFNELRERIESLLTVLNRY